MVVRGGDKRYSLLEKGKVANVAEVYIAYLRKKVDAPGEPKLIRTVRWAGYTLKGA
ncbi:MAG: winged helix-turn-helix domain-containing protein [Rubrobacteraceae bacterium]|nr:winged helix-turn-helix domain-containing protein [Rubrobacteraceae bacterium]